MQVNLIQLIPFEYPRPPLLISGDTSSDYHGKQWLSLTHLDGTETIFEIRYEETSGPFKQVELLGSLLVVGHQSKAYFYNIEKNKLLTSLDLSGYFGYLYTDQSQVFIADAEGLYCLDHSGRQIWSNKALGIDGVVVNSFTDTKIHGSGEYDPPGGWIDFVLDRASGNRLS